MSRRLLPLLGVCLAVCAVCGCRTGEPIEDERPVGPRPILALAGQSHAVETAGWSLLPAGPGAEGQPGDFVLHNARVRFVVAATDHGGSARIAGNVIDAAVQGGEDRMRLLVALIGDAGARRPVYDDVRIDNPGGAATAAVVAEGYLPGRPGVVVTTTYTLEPDSRTLEIATSVRNDTGAMLSLLSAGDALYHGRTLRFAPDVGLMPAGRAGTSTWLAFFDGGLCWGMLGPSPGQIEAQHRTGWSELRYSHLDVPAGEARTYERRLMAAVGGPARVWEEAYPIPSGTRARLVVRLVDRLTGQPVAGGQLILAPAEGSSAVLAVTDQFGETSLDLRGGKYSVLVWPPGRPAEGPIDLSFLAGSVVVQEFNLAPPAEVAVQARMRTESLVVPSAVRVATYPVPRPDAPFPPLTPFPMDGSTGALFTDLTGTGRLPLTPAGVDVPASSLVVASRGPLFKCAGERVEAPAGGTADLALTVERVVDAGDYVSIDCRQHTDASPDCAVARAERFAVNACEDLMAAVLSDPVPAIESGLESSAPTTRAISALRVQIDGVGSFSAYPLEHEAETPLDPGHLVDAVDAWDCVERLRDMLPNAVIQVDDPADPHAGHFGLTGFDPVKQRTPPPEVNAPFDAVELVTDGGAAGMERTLGYWFALLNSGRRVALTGSSGARDLAGACRGAARTFLHCPSRDPIPTQDELAAALRALKSAPNAVVSNGPFIEATLNGQPIGSVVATGGQPVQLALRVQAPPWIQLDTVSVYRDGDVVTTFPLDQGGAVLRADRVLELEAARDCWFVVSASGKEPLPALYCMRPDGPPAFAVTNAFWVDADGDGDIRMLRP